MPSVEHDRAAAHNDDTDMMMIVRKERLTIGTISYDSWPAQ